MKFKFKFMGHIPDSFDMTPQVTVIDCVGRVAPVVIGVSVDKKAKAGALIAAARPMLDPPPGPRETFILMQDGGGYYSAKIFKEEADLIESAFLTPLLLIRWVNKFKQSSFNHQ